MFLVMLMLFPIAALAASELRTMLEGLGIPFGIAHLISGLALFIVYCYVSLKFYFWPCPRCGKPFQSTVFHVYRADKCIHCGLPKWADPGAEVADHQNQAVAARGKGPTG